MAGRLKIDRGIPDALAALSLLSTKRGAPAQACAQLTESLRLIRSTDAKRAGASALDASGELASSVGELARAAELHGAADAVRRASRAPRDIVAARERAAALDRLRAALGEDRFAVAWARGRATDFGPAVEAALRWLDGLEAGQPPKPASAETPRRARAKPEADDLTSTAVLVARVQQGSAAARERLAGRYLAILRRFAHGRLPARARDLMDTDDLVQVTVIRALQKLNSIDPSRKGGFLAYMRQILMNQVRDEIRRVNRAPGRADLVDAIPSKSLSPLEETLQRELMEAYEKGLSRLSKDQRQALVLRLEHGYSYQQVAEAIGSPSPDAARMLVSRSLARLAKSVER